MEKNYTVKEFIEKYDKLATDAQRKSFINQIKVIPYISYALKQVSANKIVKTTSTDENGNINIRSSARYVFYVYNIIETYTDIKMSTENVIGEFDSLNERGLIEEIFEKIPEKERNEFKTVLDMELNDFMTNYYENHAFIEKNITRIINAINDMLPQLQPILENIKNMNAEELNNLIDFGVSLSTNK